MNKKPSAFRFPLFSKKQKRSKNLKPKGQKAPFSQLTGTVQRQADGFGFVIPDDSALPDVYLSRRAMQGVMGQDKVKVAFSPHPYRKNKFSGKVLEILARRSHSVVGPCFPLSDKTGLIKDDSFEWGEDLKIDLNKNQKIKKGEWIQAQVISWPGSAEGFRGKWVCSLGLFPKALEDNIRVVQKYSLPTLFSKESLKEAKALPEVSAILKEGKHSSRLKKNRRDLTALPFITIDGKTAQDFDDAIYVKPNVQGWSLYVAIADVSHYVRPKSALDKIAYEKGNSVYFPGWTAPMLPERLSHDLCSLKPKVLRLAFVAEMHFNHQGKREKTFFYPALIQSRARLTYGEVEDILDLKLQTVSEEIQKNIKAAKSLALKLLQQRVKNHFIQLDIPETEIKLNSLGEPTDVIQSRRLFSHQLIEEFMLSANKAVAEYFIQHKVPALYRVHDLPKVDSLKLLEKFAQSLGMKISLNRSNAIKNISLLIQHFQDHPLSEVLQILILRSLAQAVYSANTKPHFGLNTQYYTHWTSPIRRYSDLVVHRILKACLFKETLPYKKQKLESISSWISACEQRAVKAERHLKDKKKLAL